MVPLEDSIKPKCHSNFSDGELVAMISMEADNKILLVGINYQ